MNIPITYCLNRTVAGQEYLLICTSGMQMIDLQWSENVWAGLSKVLGTKIVLVGQLPQGDWKIYCEESLMPEVRKLPLELLPWRERTLDL